MTDRLEEIKQRNAKVRGFNTELDNDWDWLIGEVKRLQGENHILRANMPYGVMKRLVAQKAIAATEAPQ